MTKHKLIADKKYLTYFCILLVKKNKQNDWNKIGSKVLLDNKRLSDLKKNKLQKDICLA